MRPPSIYRVAKIDDIQHWPMLLRPAKAQSAAGPFSSRLE
jgi:hypothetical protein